MLPRIVIGVLIGFCLLQPFAYGAAAKPSILILPFTINARDDQAYLRDEIPKVIADQLRKEGGRIIDPAALQLPSPLPAASAALRAIGAQAGADYVIWGSLTRIGQKFSLDAQMLQTYGQAPPKVFFAEGDSIENLLTTVRGLTRDLVIQLFQREKIAEVSIAGNKRIEEDAIRRVIKSKPGDIFFASRMTEDLRAIWAMGYFDDIRIEAQKDERGKLVTFHVTEKPTIRVIRFKGNYVYEDDELKETLTIRTGSILNNFKVQNNIRRIETLYKEKNYHNVQVKTQIKPLKNNQADLIFQVEEGDKVRIKTIEFVGNQAFSAKKLKKVMKSSEKGFFSLITSSGDLNTQELRQDVARLSAYYHNNGYIKARVGEPKLEFKDKWIYITFKIEEGPRFKIGKVDITGDLIFSDQELKQKLTILDEEFYNREVVRNDVLMLVDLYSDEGYAYADIVPHTHEDPEKKVVDITYNIDKAQQVYFEKIIITGNSRTRDKVIRRELKVYEQELFGGKRLKRGIRNLHRLDFFEDVKVNTTKGSTDDTMVLKIDVKEKPTGTFSFGGGYSSVDALFATAAITQRNLFGRGQKLQLKADLGGSSTRYTISFTEPWLFDIPLSAGIDIYNWDRDFDTYDKDSIGGGLRFSYPVFDFTRVYLNYSFENADITNVESDAPDDIKDLEGENIESALKLALRYDSRDKAFDATRGQDHSISVERAGGGLGGDIAFMKYLAKVGWYVPIFWEFVGFAHAEGGIVVGSEGGKLPDYERFYLGGLNSLRGFDYKDIHAEDDDGTEIGGEKYVQFNFELLFPLVKSAGVRGVLFFDTGNVYGSDEDVDISDLRESIGIGFRWNSPIGPIRLEYGYILDPLEGEDQSGQWEFGMGSAF